LRLAPPSATPFQLDSTFADKKPGPWPPGWLIENGTASRKQGRYIIRAPDGYFTVRTPIHATRLANGQISAVVRAQGKGQIGVMARQSGPKNEWNLYACWITNARQYGCTLWRSGTPLTLAPAHADARIMPNHDNTLLLKLVGTQLTFIVNGLVVYHAVERSPLPTGSWGVYVASRFGTGPVVGSYSRITISGLPARASA